MKGMIMVPTEDVKILLRAYDDWNDYKGNMQMFIHHDHIERFDDLRKQLTKIAEVQGHEKV